MAKNILSIIRTGSGKTLTISWLTDRLDSLYSESNQKIFDMVIILTDRKSLDKNIKDDLVNFVHLQSKVCFAKDSDKLKNFILQRKSIVVSTIQKFSYIQEIIIEDEGLKHLRIAFIIDEAHRSQDGKLASNTKTIFTDKNKPDNEEIPNDEDELIEKAKKINISNQVLVAFTATPTQVTDTQKSWVHSKLSQQQVVCEERLTENIFEGSENHLNEICLRYLSE